MHVDGREDKSGEGESAETQRSGIGKLSVLERPDLTGVDHQALGGGVVLVPEGGILAVGAIAGGQLLLLDGDRDVLSHCVCWGSVRGTLRMRGWKEEKKQNYQSRPRGRREI